MISDTGLVRDYGADYFDGQQVLLIISRVIKYNMYDAMDTQKSEELQPDYRVH